MRFVNPINQALIDSINSSHLDVPAAITMVEDLIALEQSNLTVSTILKDEIACLRTEYKISHAEILLSLLRRHGDFLSSQV